MVSEEWFQARTRALPGSGTVLKTVLLCPIIFATAYPLRVDRGCWPGLVNSAAQMACAGPGLAIYCNAGELCASVLDSFVRGRRSRK
jgi:hypothetical protein